MAGSVDHATLSAPPERAALDHALDPACVNPALIEFSKRLGIAMQAYSDVQQNYDAAMASTRPSDASLRDRVRQARAAASEALSALASARVQTAADLVFKLAALSPSAAFLEEQPDVATRSMLALLRDVARLPTARDAAWSSAVRRSQGLLPSSWLLPWSRPRQSNGTSAHGL